ncbi:D,D-heptose 7-phosphate kinase [Caulobacter phage Cr30]|uniref:D,D-heptose 7-phosphate kinase n=1 Tax=Caulobacter phage Cr30 TaxID=1357714 RepID=UPI0004A9B600|nr:D,D-heptose 7-phosphate kinase [Caulobacter phage Cr30]AGS80893.1 D,D-heptose 7-phosphate kinase [Caulobacter phage Cr30]
MFSVARAPLRISLYGGSTDIPSFYKNNGYGAVLSFTIDKYVHVVLNKVNHDRIKIMYSQIEEVTKYEDIKHDIIRAIWKHWDLGFGWEIATFADIPSSGTGMGSSSAFTVALLSALSADPRIRRRMAISSAADLARIACFIEIDLVGSPIGKQDQYASAFGGLNYFQFMQNEEVLIENFEPPKELLEECLLFYTGVRRSANETLEKQNKADLTSEKIVMRSHANFAKNSLNKGTKKHIFTWLDEAWQIKKEFPDVQFNGIDACVEIAKLEGAYGAKVLGAGSGGYLFVATPKEFHEVIKKDLQNLGLEYTPFSFTENGAELVFKDMK